MRGSGELLFTDIKLINVGGSEEQECVVLSGFNLGKDNERVLFQNVLKVCCSEAF